MKIYIANDHAGYLLKKSLLPFLSQYGAVEDLGSDSEQPADYPLYGQALAHKIQSQDDRGILICGSGIGICIAANRFPHIRAAVCHTPEETILARQHNNINVLCLGARTHDSFESIVDTFFKTKFLEEERHVRRIQELS